MVLSVLGLLDIIIFTVLFLHCRQASGGATGWAARLARQTAGQAAAWRARWWARGWAGAARQAEADDHRSERSS